MTQIKKANAVLDSIFMQARFARVGVSEDFLREYAAKKWADKDTPLCADVLVAEAEARVATGHLKKFTRGQSRTGFYKLP